MSRPGPRSGLQPPPGERWRHRSYPPRSGRRLLRHNSQLPHVPGQLAASRPPGRRARPASAGAYRAIAREARREQGGPPALPQEEQRCWRSAGR
jgi:hypothetical protein